MTYFVLPKSYSLFNIFPSTSVSLTAESCCSHSLGLLYDKIKPQFDHIICPPPGLVENTVNSTKSEWFKDLLEIINTTNILDSKINLSVLHVGKNSSHTTDCIRMVRGLPTTYEVDAINIWSDGNGNGNGNEDNIVNDHPDNNTKYDVLCIENELDHLITGTNINRYILHLLKSLMIIIKNQKEGGSCIIKMYQTVHKPVIEFLYMLSVLFGKISIVKPKTSDPTTFVKYIVCKHFLVSSKNKDHYLTQYSKLAYFINSYLMDHKKPNIISLIDQTIPYYFVNKLDDVNVIIGQPQLEYMNQTISMGKQLGSDITKKPKLNCWGDKGNFHYNKGVDNKCNIFLQGTLKKEDSNGKPYNGFLCGSKKVLLVENIEPDQQAAKEVVHVHLTLTDLKISEDSTLSSIVSEELEELDDYKCSYSQNSISV